MAGAGWLQVRRLTESDIPEPVRRFLAAHIDSIEQLEVLMLLRAHAARAWSADDVNRELRSSVMSIRDRLGDLAGKGFLVAGEVEGALAYRYAPADGEASRLIDALASAYKARRLAVITLIYARPENDVAALSGAFEIRGEAEER